MIDTIEQAHEHCKKYDIEFTGSVIVTATGNIYPTGNVDPADTSEQFIPDMIETGNVDPADTDSKPRKNIKK